ncbi:MAG: serine/threonine protein kinase, partial [Deltaproteobacteria bacterium]|nr:serine/threonine protein kinase [Deltaproteobacteria bacterium]
MEATATGDGSSGSSSGSSDGLERGAALGRYTILSTLGAGGMGVVYAAYDPDLDRKVALKLLHGNQASQSARTRLLREARAMAKLAHPNVITVFEVGSVGAVDFVAMEFVDGPDLEGWCAEDDRSWPEVLRVFLQAGSGLAAAHRAGLVHRDFKPANVLLRDGDVALVTDFGLARTK